MAFGLSTGTLLTIGGGLLGGLAGSQGQGGGTTSSTTAPWKPQQKYLKAGFAGAQNAYNNANQMGAYGGQRVAGLNPFQPAFKYFCWGFQGAVVLLVVPPPCP